MATQVIEIREEPRDPLEIWAYVTETKIRIREIAIELLASLRFEEGKSKARVYVNGSCIQVKKSELQAVWDRMHVEEGTDHASEN
jgi:hypothetical protein